MNLWHQPSHRAIFLQCVLVVGLLWPWMAGAQTAPTSPIVAETRVAPGEVTIAEQVLYSIIVRHDPEIQVAPPDPTPHFQDFQLIDRGTAPQRKENGKTVDEFQFRLRADRVGNYPIPPVEVHFSAPDPNQPDRMIPGRLLAPKADIVVRSVLFDDGTPQDIKNLKPIIGAGPNWDKYLRIAMWVVLGLIAWIFFLRWLRPKTISSSPSPAIPQVSPHELALKELDALLARQWIEQGRFREHYFELSEIFRRFLGAIHSIPAPDWTTEEIETALTQKPDLPIDYRNRIMTLLRATDRIKFAKAPVDVTECREHVHSIREWIQDSAQPSTPAENQPTVSP